MKGGVGRGGGGCLYYTVLKINERLNKFGGRVGQRLHSKERQLERREKEL